MTLCPVALAITCKKCPVVSFCPGKEIIGDFKPEEADSGSEKKLRQPAIPRSRSDYPRFQTWLSIDPLARVVVMFAPTSTCEASRNTAPSAACVML